MGGIFNRLFVVTDSILITFGRDIDEWRLVVITAAETQIGGHVYQHN